MGFDVRTADLSKLNSLTKYPSIPTYHALDTANGLLIENGALPLSGDVIGTEKIDGTNARIICLPDGSYLLGSREELLYAKGDLIGNPAMGIVEALKPVAERLRDMVTDQITVYYLEVFGGKVTAASKQYTGSQRVSYDLFDVAWIANLSELLAMSLPQISAWREGGGQTFVEEDRLLGLAFKAQLAVTPRLFIVPAERLPTSIEAMHSFLQVALPKTHSLLDTEGGGRAEGMVLRTTTRSAIAKVRFEDYERTLK